MFRHPVRPAVAVVGLLVVALVAPANDPAKLTVQNDSQVVVELVYLPAGGQPKVYRELKPGESYTQDTFAGHKWRLRDKATGKELNSVTAGPGAAILAVGGPAAPPGPGKAPAAAELVIQNTTAGPLKFVPVGADGREGADVTDVPAGRTVRQKVAVGQKWVLKDAAGKLLNEGAAAAGSQPVPLTNPNIVNGVRRWTGAVDQPAKAGPADKPAGDARAAELTITNRTAGVIQVYWQPAGSPGGGRLFHELKPGEGYKQATFVGHQWRVQDKATGAVLKQITAAPGAHAFAVTPPTADQKTTGTGAVGTPAGSPPTGTGSPAGPDRQGTGSQLSRAEADDLLAVHNAARREVGTPPLKWSAELAGFAQAWADELARTGQFEHRPKTPGRWQQKHGENIASLWGDGAEAVVHGGATMWLGEKPRYTPGTPFPSDFGSFQAGHYTQMVWRGTTAVGAGKAVVQTGPNKGAWVLVANYDPPGNMAGQKPY